MTTPSAHDPYPRLARRSLIGPGSIPQMSDWEVFLHGFSDTNQRGSSRDIYDCLINLFPTPESVLDWPKFDRETGEPLDLPETGGCANLRTRGGAAQWLRDNAIPENWKQIQSLMRCKRRNGREIPGRQTLAKDFSNGSTKLKDGSRTHPGGLNFQLRQIIQGAGLKGADMHLLWGGCEVPVIDIQMMRYISPYVIGMSFEENARQKLAKKIGAGGSLNISGVEPISTRVVLPTDEINPELRRNITAMEQEEAARIQKDKNEYEKWRNVAYELAEKEGMPANEWHVANWLEFRPPSQKPSLGRGDPDRKGRRPPELIEKDNERLALNIEFIEGTFAPTKFPDAPAEWPLPNDRYPRREQRKRLAQMEEAGLSPEEMVARERSLYPQETLTPKVAIEQLEYFHREQGRYQTPGDYDREKTPTIFHGTIFDFSPEEIGRGTSREGIWLSSNRAAAEKIAGFGPSILAPEGAKEINGARVLGYRIKPEARIHTIPYWDGIKYEPLIEAMVREGADVLEILRTDDIGAHRNFASYYLVQNPSVLEPVSITQAQRGVTGWHEVSLWDAPETPDAFVGFEGPFGFDDDITKQSKDWIQYKIGTTPVVVRRVGAKPGVKLDPRYQGANQPQELLIEFRLRASTRRDMEKINFLLERLREDNPTMTVNVNVKTNGKSAQRSLPTWEDRPYRLEPGAWFGFETPKDFDDRIHSWEWTHAEVDQGINEMDGTTINTWHEGLDGLDGEEKIQTEIATHPAFDDEDLSAEELKSHYDEYFSTPDESEVIWDIDGIRVTVAYHTMRLGDFSIDPMPIEVVKNAAEISWVRTGGETSRETFSQINALLDGIHENNPGIRIFAHAVGEQVQIDPKTKKPIILRGRKDALYVPRGRGGIRARVYERSGWTKLYDQLAETSGDAMMEWLPPDQRNPGTPTAFDGIDAYADAIMALV